MYEMECVESQRLGRNVPRGDVKVRATLQHNYTCRGAIQKAIRLSLKAHSHLLKKKMKTNETEIYVVVFFLLISLPVCT